MTNAPLVLASAANDAAAWGLVGAGFVLLAVVVALLGGFVGRERDE